MKSKFYSSSYLFLVLFLCENAFSQVVNMPNQGSQSIFFTSPGQQFSFYDDGGFSNYLFNSQGRLSFVPQTGFRVKVEFVSFSTEASFDALYIFNADSVGVNQIPGPGGAVIGGPPLPSGVNSAGNWQGSTSPGTIIATQGIANVGSNPTNSLSFHFHSDAAVNQAGWFAIVSQVCIDDTTPPDFNVQTCPQNITLSAPTGSCSAIFFDDNGPDATDDCPPFFATVTNNINNQGNIYGVSFPVGINSVIWTATDAVGNTSTCVWTIQVFDFQAPSITCPGSIIVGTDPGVCTANLTLPPPQSLTDNCPNPTYTTSPGNGIYNQGSTLVSYYGLDASGNTDTCSTFVFVFDDEPPVLICPPTQTVSANSTSCNATITSVPPVTETDNCDSPAQITSYLSSPTLPATLPVGTHTFIYEGFDLNYNFDTCHFNVVIVDDTPPTITCPPNQTFFSAPNQCQATVNIPPATTSDNCGIETTTRSPSGNIFQVGATIVTFTTEDLYGNTSTCTMTVTVIDAVPPVITCPSNITTSTDPGSCFANVNLPPGTATDNCAVDFIFNNGQNPFFIGTTPVTYTAVDVNGNFSTCSMTVTVLDNENPTITCPANITQGNDPGECEAFVTVPPAIVSDNCGVAFYDNGYNGTTDASDTYPVGTTLVVWYVQDYNGLFDTCHQLITITDVEPPVITCPADQTANTDPNQCQANVNIPPATATDNCGIQGIFRNPAGNIFQIGTTLVTFTALCLNGDSSTCTMTVTVNDVQPPSLTCPSNLTVNTDPGECSADITLPDATGTDNCGFDFSQNDAPSPFPIGSTLVTFTGFDISGNSATCTMTVLVVDNENPTIVCPANITQNSDTDACEAFVDVPQPTVADNCGIEFFENNINFTDDASGDYPVGTTTIEWKVQDLSGNTATCTMTVTVIDNQPPDIICPADITANNTPNQCQATVNIPPATATDNCGIEAIFQNPTGNTFPVGTTVITFTALDLTVNTASCTMTVEVFDVQPPVLTCPSNLTANTDPGNCSADITLPDPTGVDNCGFDFSQNDAPSPFPVGTTTVTFTGFDIYGNSATCTMTVSVFDNEVPTIVCPANITQNNDTDACEAFVSVPQPTVDDNCGIEFFSNNYTGDDDASGDYPVGTTTVIWTVEDLSGNTSTCAMTVTVIDNQAPTITCPADITVNNTPNQCQATVNVPNATATDNCGIAQIFKTPPGSIFQVGTTTVTFTAQDFSGNTTSCTMTVTVLDVQPPVLTCPSNLTVDTDPGVCTSSVSLPDATGTDNCGFDFSTNDAPNPFPLGTTLVTFTGFDINGNSATCTTTVTVEDNENPTITCPADIVQDNDPGLCEAFVAVPQPTVGDNCGVDFFENNYTGDDDASGDYPVGTTTVVWTVFDENGNSSTCAMTVTVEDNEAPEILDCPADQTLANDPGLCSAVVDPGQPEAQDNCTPANQLIFSDDAPTGNVFPVGSTTVIFTVTDSEGNFSTCSATITVEDLEPPVIVCPAPITLQTAPDECVGYAFLDDPTITDNCDDVSQVFDVFQDPDPANGDYPVGTTTVTFFVFDLPGNESTCTTTVTVQDAQPPTITCPPNITAQTSGGSCMATVNFNPPTVADNCPNPQVSGPQSPLTLNAGTFPQTFTVTDASGNSAVCTFNITVIGDTASISITCPPNLTVSADPDTCAATNVDFGNAVATAACGLDTLFNNAPPVFPLGQTTVIFTAIDSTGASDTCSMTVTVEDNTPPTLTCPLPFSVPTNPNSCTATVNIPAPVFQDNCPTGWQVPSDSTFQNVPIGVQNFIFNATNGILTISCGVQVTVTGSDSIGITCPANLTVNTDPNLCTATVQLGQPTVFAGCGIASVTNDAPVVFPIGTTTVIFTLTDNSGKTATCAMTVTVLDNQPPNITCPQDIFQNVDAGQCTATVNIAPTVNDNCSTNFTISTNPSNPFPIGTTLVVVTATDDAGNTATCTLQVVISENEPPVLTCPANLTANTDPGECSAFLDFENQILITDNCGATDSLQGQTSGTFPLGISTVLLTAFDGNGNSSTCQISIEVIDNEAPEIICPQPITQPIDPTGCVATVTIPAPTATDNCVSPVEISPVAPLTQVLPIGQHSVVFTATAGNLSSTCSVQITVTGTTNLTITCPPNQTVNNDAGECFATLDLPAPEVVADCGLQNLVNDAPATFPIGTTTVIFTVTDGVGGTATCSMQVLVNDAEVPQLACPPNTTVNATTGDCEAVADFDPAVLTDNCPFIPANLTSSILNGDLLPVGNNTLTFNYLDANAVPATCSFIISVLASPTSLTLNETICEGDTTTAGGQQFFASGTFLLTLTNAAGCDSLLTLNLNVIPTAILLRDTSICEGDSILLGGIFRKTAGVYQDVLTVPATGCDSIITTTLSINPKPKVEIMGPLSLCPGAVAVLTAGLFNGYSWSPAGQTTPQISINQPGNYSVVVTDANGCSAVDSINIIDYCGVVNADFTPSFDTICTDFYIEFEDESAGSPGPVVSWFWDFGNGNFSNLQNPFTYYPNPGKYKVKLVACDAFVCDTTEQELVIYPRLNANFSYQITDPCKPTELDFNGSAGNNASLNPVNSWRWDFGDGIFSNIEDPKHQYEFYDTVSTTLIVQDIFGCTDSITQVIPVVPNGIAPLPVDLKPVLCPGEKFTVGAQVFDENKLSGQVILKSFHNCDSIINVQLSYIPGGNINMGDDKRICENQTTTLDAGPATNWLWSTGATTQTITVSAAGTYSVTIEASNGNCQASGKIEVFVDTVPNLAANAGVDQGICASTQFVKLDAFKPSVGTGAWSTTGAAAIDNSASEQSFVSNLAAGDNIFTWTLSNGACQNYSSDQMKVAVTAISNEQAAAGANLAFCSGADVQMNATPPVGAGITGAWSQPSGQNLTISSLTDPKATISGLNADDVFVLFWTLSNGFCGEFSKDEVLISRSPDFLEDADAGENLTLCDETSTPIEGNQIPGTVGRWSVVGDGGTAVIGNVLDPTTSITNIAPGVLRIAWTLSGTGPGGCPNYSSDTISILQSGGLKANDDGYKDIGQPFIGLDFLANDVTGDPAEVVLTFLSTPQFGSLTAQSDGSYNFSFGGSAPTNVDFRYRICLRDCPTVCSDATVKIVTSEPVPALIRPANVFTPNGDGVADFFEIPNYLDIPAQMPITLTVVNRWGDVLFKTERYDNKWDGRDNNGNLLPEGTYFFVLRGGGGDGEETGYITIFR